MFCMQCGEKLPDGAKFCRNCGSRLPINEELPKTVAVAETTPLNNLEPSYIAGIYADVFDMAETLSKSFTANMDRKYPGLDEFMLGGVQGINDIFQHTEKLTLRLLHGKGIYHMSEVDIQKYTRKYMGYCADVLSQLEVAYENVVGQGQEALAYSNYLKENHSRLVGGGFGIVGAAKGIALAGAVNATIGAFHSYAANTRERMIDSELSECKRLIYWNSSFREALAFAIETDIKESIHGICELFSALGLGQIPFYPIENLFQVPNILNAVVEGKVAKAEYEKVAYQIIQLYPVHRNVYLYAADICPEKKAVFFDLAQQHGIDIGAYFSELDEDAKPYAEHLVQNSVAIDLLKANTLSFDVKKNVDLICTRVGCNLNPRFAFFSQKRDSHYNLWKKTKKEFLEYLDDEFPILLLDTSGPCNGAEGVVLTDQGVYAVGYTYSKRWSADEYLLMGFDYYTVGEDVVLTFGNFNKAMKPHISEKETKFLLELLDFFITMTLYVNAIKGIRIISEVNETGFAEKIRALADISFTDQDGVGNNEEDEEDSEDDSYVEYDSKILVEMFNKFLASEKKRPTYYYTEKGSLFHAAIPSSNDWLDRDLRVINKVYDDFDDTEETLVFYYDCSIGATFRESFLMTDLYFHFHSKKHGSWKIKYKDINKVTVEGMIWPYIAINGNHIPFTAVEEVVKEFAYDLRHYFIPFFRNFGECILE